MEQPSRTARASTASPSITNLTKMIDGVETVVAYVEDYTEGELVEMEIFLRTG